MDLTQINPDDSQQLSEFNRTAMKLGESERRSSEQREAASHLMERLWPKMANLYGFKFTSQFGEYPADDWATVMTGVTGRQIADGLNACLDRFPEWPPGAAQFRALCLGIHLDKDGNECWQHKKIEAVEKQRLEREKAIPIEDGKLISKRKRAAEVGIAELKNLVGLI